MILVTQAQHQKQHGQYVTHQPRIGRTLNAHGRQPEPAEDQCRGQQQAYRRGHHQRQQRRNRVTDPAQNLGKQNKHQQQRHDQHHHAGIAHRLFEHVHRRAQCLQGRPRQQAAQYRRQQADQCTEGQRSTRDLLDHRRFPRPPGLADQHRRARPQADHQGNKEEHDGKHPRHRRQRLSTQQLPDIDPVKGAGEALQKVGQHHGRQKDQVDPPQRPLRRGLHKHSAWKNNQRGLYRKCIRMFLSNIITARRFKVVSAVFRLRFVTVF